MNEQTSNPNATNKEINEQAAVSSLLLSVQRPSLKSSRRYSLRFRRKRTLRAADKRKTSPR